MKGKIHFLIVIAALFMLQACKNKPSVPDVNSEFEKQLQEKFINAQEGDIIELPEGTFNLNHTLVLDKAKNITVRGKGNNKTILSFKAQKVGGDGFRISAGGITLESFSVIDTKGDAIKIKDAENVALIGIKTTWTSLHSSANGWYGLSIVNCTGVMIEDCEVSGASTAGIYVSQCKNIIARKNHTHDNVAGMEIENSTDADIYENLSENNAQGILLLAVPGLQKKISSRFRVFNNRLLNNNGADFGMKGTVVSEIPSGTGIFVMAGSQVDLFTNECTGQNSPAIDIISYRSLQKSYTDSAYYPYSAAISIHENKIIRGSGSLDDNTILGKLFTKNFNKQIPDIVYDGEVGPNAKNTDGTFKESERICIHNNGNISFSNLDLPNQGKNRSNDISKYNCSLAPLIEIKLN